MAYEIGFVDQSGATGFAHKEFLVRIRRLVLGYGNAAAPGYSGTGNGTMTGLDTYPATLTETWTIQCTAAAVNGGTFSVTGSVSGAQAAATVGTPYDNGFIKFTINDGTTDFIVGDAFTVQTTAGALPIAQRWTQLAYDTSDPTSHKLYLKGAGLSGDKEIFVGFRTYESVTADYYNLTAAGFIGYIPGEAWSAQPGFIESGIPGHNQRIDYWLVADGQSINFGLKVGTPVYESGGVGFFKPYARPSQYGYPMYVAGMLNGAAATRYSETSHSMAWKGARANFVIRDTQGIWVQPSTYPWSNARVGGATSQLRDTNDEYPILAVQIYQTTPNLWGEFGAIGYVSNFNNTVESVVQKGGTPVVDDPGWTSAQRVQAIIDAGGEPWLCLQDVARTSFNDYFALRMA